MVWLDFIFTRGLIRGEQKSTMGDTALQVVVVGETIWDFHSLGGLWVSYWKVPVYCAVSVLA